MLKKASLIAACLGVLLMTAGARADERNKETIVTFNKSVAVPGVVLPAGTYVFKLINPSGSLATVEVSSAADSKALTTFNAIPVEHATPREKAYIGIEERPAGSPDAIREWWYPGDSSGLEFLYR